MCQIQGKNWTQMQDFPKRDSEFIYSENSKQQSDNLRSVASVEITIRNIHNGLKK